MSDNVPPRVQFSFGSDEPEVPEQEPPLPDFESYEDEVGLDDDQDLDLPEVVEKPKPVKEDIFDLPNLAVMPEKVKEDLKYEGMEDGVDYLKEQTKGQKKKRKPMTEEHKAKLGKAREKAMVVRKAKAEEKKKMKALDNEEKELLKKQKYKKVQKLKEEVDSDEEGQPVKKERLPPPTRTGERDQRVGVTTFTKKDLEDAQYDAIIKYDTLRKQRKAEKKKVESIEKSKQELIEKLKPKQYQYRDGSNRWDNFY